MRKLIYLSAVIITSVASCKHNELKQGTIAYTIEYQLPDSLKTYAEFLPKTATVYFKGDSTVSIQQAGPEATTVITHKPTNFMLVLLRSDKAQYAIDYKKAEQSQVLPPTEYNYGRTNDTKTIAGHKATRYVLTDKWNGLASQVWFTKDIKMVPNYLTTAFDTSYGVPVAIESNQNNIITKTTVKEIKFEPIPEGVFSTPAGYKKLTPEQFKNLPVGE